MIANGELQNVELLAGKGFHRWSQFTQDQMYTFITLRALSASPLMMGGDLQSLDDFSLMLITNEAVINCNQNGVMGSLVYDNDGIEIWKTPEKGSNNGWIGIFNRTEGKTSVSLDQEKLGLETEASFRFRDIWNLLDMETLDFDINTHGVVFLEYKAL